MLIFVKFEYVWIYNRLKCFSFLNYNFLFLRCPFSIGLCTLPYVASWPPKGSLWLLWNTGNISRGKNQVLCTGSLPSRVVMVRMCGVADTKIISIHPQLVKNIQPWIPGSAHRQRGNAHISYKLHVVFMFLYIWRGCTQWDKLGHHILIGRGGGGWLSPSGKHKGQAENVVTIR